MVWRFPFNALLAQYIGECVPIAVAETHSAREVAKPAVALLFPAAVVLLPQLSAAYRVEPQEFAILAYKIIGGEILVVDILLEFVDAGLDIASREFAFLLLGQRQPMQLLPGELKRIAWDIVLGNKREDILEHKCPFGRACIVNGFKNFKTLVLVACCPGGSSSNVFSMLAKGDVALSVTLTALSSIVTLFTLPVIMAFVAEFVSSSNGLNIHLPIGKLFMQNIVLLFVPLLTGALFRKIKPNAATKTARVLGKLAFPALMTLAAVFFLQYRREIADNFTLLGLSGVMLILLAMLCSGGLSRIGKFTAGTRRTIVIEVGMQNAAQAIAIASSPFIFNSGEMTLPAIIYALLMNVILLLYVYFIRRKDERNRINSHQR